ncbi:Rhodanese-related sulfurtransferase [Evansella caseinilytica]|uniref:Rhodanese-related sulfurtransferase n=1 Tax=Evansella caseinilytica TaxID=1503961 RepID=A0A1H3TFP0_9BACI|nr:rhodanese-like domain-containing protein [Evansella caseinilytica]SDZ48708.1 Rhodanese-related sulfurtransferase [Evansella caseinilytica]
MDTVITGALILAAIWLLAAKFIPVKGIKQISAADLKKIVKTKNRQFVDVRTPAEYNGNHIPGFKNIPVTDLVRGHQELSRDKEIIFICHSGVRSLKAAKILKKLGFEKITNVKGGMTSWQQQ